MTEHVSTYPKPQMHIAGEWVAEQHGARVAIVDPATEVVLGEFHEAAPPRLDDLLGAADQAAIGWARTPIAERASFLGKAAALLRSRADHIARVITLEQGKPLSEARGEVLRSADLIDWNARAAVDLLGREGVISRGRGSILQVPVGPVAAFTPWNVPLYSPARKISMALAMGCVCILKPAEETPGAAIELVRALADSGLPPGVLGLVLGNPGQISEYLIRSPIIRKVTFTGSVPVGKHLAALAGSVMKPVTMELGGHNPAVILDGADIGAAARAAAKAKFRNAGQICTSPTRFYVHASHFDGFLAAFAAETRAIRVGSGLDPQTGMGPVVNRRRLEAMEQLVSGAVAGGASVAAGGARIGTRGYFFAPTILTDIEADSVFMQEEPFGPLAGVFPFSTIDEAIAHCNATALGLAAYVFAGTAESGRAVAEAIESGIVGINSFSVSHPELPFGGMKDSGYGREGGIEGMKAFLMTRVLVQ